MNELQKYKMWQDQFVHDMIGSEDNAPLVYVDVAQELLQKMPDSVIATIIGSLILQNLADHRENPLESALILANRLTNEEFVNAAIDTPMF